MAAAAAGAGLRAAGAACPAPGSGDDAAVGAPGCELRLLRPGERGVRRAVVAAAQRGYPPGPAPPRSGDGSGRLGPLPLALPAFPVRQAMPAPPGSADMA